MKYIFVTGAPGSKWSSVVKNIYYSSDIDRTDYRENRLYYHDASGKMELMHLGAYFDPGMEFDLSSQMNLESKEMLEQFFDSAFAPNSTGVRIIKSHIFSNHIDFIKRTWPDCPIVLVHRPDDACLGWWVKCGHFTITYPDYAEYYVDLKTMAQRIQEQNQNILYSATHAGNRVPAADNLHLAQILGIAPPPPEYQQNYAVSDIEVTVI